MPSGILRRAALLAGIVSALGPVGARAATEPSGFIPFASDSIWNLPLRNDAPLSPNSAAYVSSLQQSVAAKGAWLNTTSCGMPEYWADPNTPTVTVTLEHPSYEDPALIRAWSAVPMPAEAQPANCSDRNFAVLQQQPGGAIKEWEFWKASQNASGSWTAEWGGAMNNVLTDRGIASPLEWSDPTAPTAVAGASTYSWNVTASGISMLAGVITNSDLASGQIDHALAMAVSSAAAGYWMWPAQRTDGYSVDPAALPEGAHLRLDPSLDLSTLHLTPIVRMIAEAAQKYGIVVRDQTYSANVFYMEQPLPGQANPITPLLAGQSLSSALAAFPWSDLEVLNAPTCTGWSWYGCSATQQAVINVNGSETVGSTVTLDTSNSVLNYPRAQVQWDLNGSGTFATPGGTGVSTTLTLTTAGTQTVGVRITTADGSVVSGTTSFVVAPSTSGLTSSTPVPIAVTSPTSPTSSTGQGAPVPASSGAASSTTVASISSARRRAAGSAARAEATTVTRIAKATSARRRTRSSRRTKPAPRFHSGARRMTRAPRITKRHP